MGDGPGLQETSSKAKTLRHMLVPADCPDYPSLVERQAPLGFARHFALVEHLADRQIQLTENAMHPAGMAPMPMALLGEYTRQDHRFRWANNELVQALHSLARDHQGYGSLLQEAFDPDLLSPFEIAAAISELVSPDAAFLQLPSPSGFVIVMVSTPPPEVSLNATLAALRESARSCRGQEWLPSLVRQLGFQYSPRECTRGDESFVHQFRDGRLVLAYGETRPRLRKEPSPAHTALVEQGLIAFSQENFDTAHQAFTQAVALDPQSYKANLYLGRIELHRENFARAALRLQLAAHLEPTRTFALSQLAICYDRNNQPTLALRTRRKALALDPDDSYSQAHLGILLGRAGQLHEGIEALEAAVQLDEHRAYPVRELAALYQKSGRIGEAVRAYEHALALEPGHAYATEQLRKLLV